ncbi:MAG: glycerol-3-phosphate acyltransferase [Lachnospiraceae bacterium]|nr:glycerol-3-phosphate acyltransferase [Lachnospiraceae bacterium]
MIRVVCFGIGYLFGLFQTSYIIGKIKGIDIRDYGSGNAGTTNMIRTLGAKWGLITFAGDFLKSWLACILVGALFSSRYPECIPMLRLYAGAGAVIAHDFPFYMNFRGGKGVAASAGMAMGFRPVLLAFGLAVFLGVSIPTKYVSAGSIACYAAFFLGTVVMGLTGQLHMAQPFLIETDILAFLLMCLCWWKHRANIVRLIHGTESKTHLFHKDRTE